MLTKTSFGVAEASEAGNQPLSHQICNQLIVYLLQHQAYRAEGRSTLVHYDEPNHTYISGMRSSVIAPEFLTCP